MFLTWSSLEELGITRGPARRTMLKYRVASNMTMGGGPAAGSQWPRGSGDGRPYRPRPQSF